MAERSAMHRVLVIQELLTTIFQFLGEGSQTLRPTLNALVRVCKTFHEPAMKELWSTQKSLLPIILVLLGGAIQVRDVQPVGYDSDDEDDDDEDEDGRTRVLYLQRDLNVQDVELLRRYALRVRELELDTGYRRYIVDSSIAQAFEDERIRPLFPRLTKLSWYTRSSRPSLAQFEPFYRVVLAPDVKSIHLKGGLDSRLLSPIPERCLKVENITVHDEEEERYSYDMPPLRDSGFPFGWPQWCLLMPTLRTLSLCLFPDGATSNRSLWRHMPVWSLPIRILHLETNDVRRAADFLTNAKLEYLTSIKIRLTRRPKLPSCEEVEELFKAISDACCTNKLQKISIFKAPFHRGYQSTEIRNKESHIIRSDVFEPLLKLTDMSKLKIHGPGGWYWDLDDALISQLCKTWTRLRTLVLDPNDRWPSKSRITLRTLESFIRAAPLLTDFGATIDATNAPKSEVQRVLRASDGRHQNALRRLRLDHSQIDSVPNFAAFLCSLFPNVRGMDAGNSEKREACFVDRRSSTRETSWSRVASFLLPFRFFVAQEQLWLMADDIADPLARLAACRAILSKANISHPGAAACTTHYSSMSEGVPA
ncbi:hypothetical protein QCA50_015439 [Cerrena zonata]|uniref:Uncharacterized protein n=1 Tax=Cerrena zonata TaxID=2478898 RepID=A0AAW0FUY8_9APHY